MLSNKNRYVHVGVVGERAILIANIIMKREIIYYRLMERRCLLLVPCQPDGLHFSWRL